MSVHNKAACFLLIILATTASCTNRPPRLDAPSIKPSAAAAKAMEQYDSDKDRKLGAGELDNCPALKKARARIDTDGDGALTADEIAARLQSWVDAKIGRMNVSCTVLHNGVPLPDAQVTFVPEAFIEDVIPSATGTTADGGVAMLSVPLKADEPPGMAPGMYRVEIAKFGVPAKYNSKTILGAEVDPTTGAKGSSGELTFNLRY